MPIKEKGVFDLSEFRALIGKEAELTEYETYIAQCPVDASEIRRYAMAVEDYNPLWFDNEYAKNTRWKGIIAPPTFMHTCGGGTILTTAHIDGTPDWPHGSLFAGSYFEFYLPIRIGDRIRPVSKFYDVIEKTGKFAGPIVFVTSQTDYTNQNNELIGIWRQIVAKYSMEEAKKMGTYTSEELGELFPHGYPDMRHGKPTARGATPLYYEDVSIGTELPSLVRDLTIPQIVSTADVSQRIGNILPHTMPGPGCYWHYAAGESWKIRGLPAPMDEGPIRAAQPSQLMTDWIGDDGWLSTLDFQVRRPIYAGDTTTWKGKVTNKFVKDGKHVVECEIWGENQRGQISTKGNSTVILLSRD
jgi:acyl dehydratase